jgi:amidase
MGDGEIGGTGIEIGGNVLIEVDLLKSKTTDFPVTETESSWITHGVANEDITEAMRLATLEAANLLVTQWGFSMEDAFIFLSVRGDLGIAQNVHPSKGTVIAKLKVPKLAACPTPFNPNR